MRNLSLIFIFGSACASPAAPTGAAEGVIQQPTDLAPDSASVPFVPQSERLPGAYEWKTQLGETSLVRQLLIDSDTLRRIENGVVTGTDRFSIKHETADSITVELMDEDSHAKQRTFRVKAESLVDLAAPELVYARVPFPPELLRPPAVPAAEGSAQDGDVVPPVQTQ